MEVKKEVVIGSVESNDILIKISSGKGVVINLQSSVIKQYGEDIRNTIRSVVDELGVSDVTIDASDKGALDFTIKARVKTALKSACES
ncbi:MAG: citrate lyase acyl carrier protein [Bacilli bacterium]